VGVSVVVQAKQEAELTECSTAALKKGGGGICYDSKTTNSIRSRRDWLFDGIHHDVLRYY